MAEAAVVSLIIGALVGGVASVSGSLEQNKQAKRVKGAAARARENQVSQIKDQESNAVRQQKRKAAQILGRIRAAGAAKGLGGGGTLTDLEGSTNLTLGEDIGTIQQNALNSIAGARSREAAIFAGTNTSNTLLSGLTGLLGGASAGLQLGSGISDTFGNDVGADTIVTGAGTGKARGPEGPPSPYR